MANAAHWRFADNYVSHLNTFSLMKTTYHFTITCSNNNVFKSKEYTTLEEACAGIANALTYAKSKDLAVFDIRTRKVVTQDDGSTTTTGWI